MSLHASEKGHGPHSSNPPHPSPAGPQSKWSQVAGRQAIPAHKAHDRQPIDLWHLEVEQCEIRMRALDECDRVRTAGRFPDQLYAVERPQRRRQERSGRSLIVGNDDSHRDQPARAAALARSMGTRTSIVVPTPGALRTAIDAESP